MKTRGTIGSCTLVGAAALLLALGCGNANVETADQTQGAGQTAGGDVSGVSANSAAGVQWTVPDGWETGPPRTMRIATYLIGKGEMTAECAVFYFGAGQGGSVEDNIDRWISQFEQPDGSDSHVQASTGVRTIAGLTVTSVDVTGIYNAGMEAPMGTQGVSQQGYRLLGAIVSAPQGPVFFKLTGPAETVAAAFPAFGQLIASVVIP